MTDLAQEQFGPYLITRKVGQGGMAIIYRAKDTRHDRYVALKVMKPGMENKKEFLKRFRREAQNTAKLQHPHILPIYDSDVLAGTEQLYIAMAWVGGGSVADLIAQSGGSIPLPEVARIIGQVASALDFAHRHDIIHRDVKPSNILLTEDGQAVLADFGIAKAAYESRLTVAGVSMGTAFYMAPEQLKDHDIDGRIDIYALGITLYQMLTGRPPFTGMLNQILMKHLKEEPPAISVTRPDLPPELDNIIAKALAKQPEDRYQTALELSDALRSVIPAEKQPATNPMRLLVAGAAIALVVGLIVFGSMFWPKSVAAPAVNTAEPKPLATATDATISPPELASPAENELLPQGTKLAWSWDGYDLRPNERFRFMLYSKTLDKIVSREDWTTNEPEFRLLGLATGDYRWYVIVERQVERNWVEIGRSPEQAFLVRPVAVINAE